MSGSGQDVDHYMVRPKGRGNCRGEPDRLLRWDQLVVGAMLDQEPWRSRRVQSGEMGGWICLAHRVGDIANWGAKEFTFR